MANQQPKTTESHLVDEKHEPTRNRNSQPDWDSEQTTTTTPARDEVITTNKNESNIREQGHESDSYSSADLGPDEEAPAPEKDGGTAAWLVVLGAWCVSFCSYGWINSMSQSLLTSTSTLTPPRHRNLPRILRIRPPQQLHHLANLLDPLSPNLLHVFPRPPDRRRLRPPRHACPPRRRLVNACVWPHDGKHLNAVLPVPHRPAIPHLLNQPTQHNRKHHTPQTTPRTQHPKRQPPSLIKPPPSTPPHVSPTPPPPRTQTTFSNTPSSPHTPPHPPWDAQVPARITAHAEPTRKP